jgi:murein DD-endopeptidase MepM/ murein hydrolase activator NlpD
MTADRSARSGLALLVAAVPLIGLAGAAEAQEASPPAESAAPADAASPEPLRERFRWPLRGPIVEPFRAGTNDGIDIGAHLGEAVHAAADGVCIAAGEPLKTYGKLVVLRHADGFVTVYAGNSELEIKEGDTVRRGEIIAKSGESGAGGTPRLHFELRKDGKAIDPIRYLVPL